MSKFTRGLKMAFYAAVAGLAIVSVRGLSDPKGAEQALRDDARFHDVEYTGHKVFGCDRHDLYRDEFKAKNADDQEVKVLVCQGLPVVGKAPTIRILPR